MEREGSTIYQEQVRRLTEGFTEEAKENLEKHLEFLVRTTVLTPGEKQIVFMGYDVEGYCYIVGENRFHEHETATRVLKDQGYSFEESFYYGNDLMGYTNIEIWTR